jgi:hypothetical protein
LDIGFLVDPVEKAFNWLAEFTDEAIEILVAFGQILTFRLFASGQQSSVLLFQR